MTKFNGNYEKDLHMYISYVWRYDMYYCMYCTVCTYLHRTIQTSKNLYKYVCTGEAVIVALNVCSGFCAFLAFPKALTLSHRC